MHEKADQPDERSRAGEDGRGLAKRFLAAQILRANQRRITRKSELDDAVTRGECVGDLLETLGQPLFVADGKRG